MPVGAPIAVVKRQPEDPLDRRRAARSRLPRRRRRCRRACRPRPHGDPVQRIGEQLRQVPVQAVVEPHGTVGEAMDDLEADADRRRGDRARRDRFRHRGRPRRTPGSIHGRAPRRPRAPAACADRGSGRAASASGRVARTTAAFGTSTLRISSPPETTWKSFSLNERGQEQRAAQTGVDERGERHAEDRALAAEDRDAAEQHDRDRPAARSRSRCSRRRTTARRRRAARPRRHTTPESTNSSSFVRLTRMPAWKAASWLSPIAYRDLPERSHPQHHAGDRSRARRRSRPTTTATGSRGSR